MRWLRWVTVAVMVMGLGASAQQTGPQGMQPEPSTGTVTGLVIASDTQRPARFVQVQLQRIVPEGGSGPGTFGSGQVNVRTDIDGTFTAVRVAVGDYYAMATETGYVSQAALLRAQIAAGNDPAALLAALPVVRVTADGSSNVTVTMQRGGVIAGHVEWEDGSSASGVSVNVNSTTAALNLGSTPMARLLNFDGGRPFVRTDDRGNFRIAGLASGEYVVTAILQALSQQGGVGRLPGYVSPSRIYAPGVFRRADAKTISVRAGDERTDVRIVIDLRGLHTVSGHASSANSGEVVATGGVHLADTSDNNLQIQAQVDVDGSFKLRYVPPGTYTLRITGANSQAPNFNRGVRGGQRDGGSQPKGTAYQDFATTVTVGDTDVTGVAVSLVPKPSQ